MPAKRNLSPEIDPAKPCPSRSTTRISQCPKRQRIVPSKSRAESVRRRTRRSRAIASRGAHDAISERVVDAEDGIQSLNNNTADLMSDSGLVCQPPSAGSGLSINQMMNSPNREVAPVNHVGMSQQPRQSYKSQRTNPPAARASGTASSGHNTLPDSPSYSDNCPETDGEWSKLSLKERKIRLQYYLYASGAKSEAEFMHPNPCHLQHASDPECHMRFAFGSDDYVSDIQSMSAQDRDNTRSNSVMTQLSNSATAQDSQRLDLIVTISPQVENLTLKIKKPRRAIFICVDEEIS